MKGFFRKLDQIDAVVKCGATRENAEAIVSLATDLPSSAYALNLLDSRWLGPLEAAGFFRGKAAINRGSDEATEDSWVASSYLKKIAREAAADSDLAQAIYRILSFMPSPKSFPVVRDMIEVSVMLPREMRKAIVPVVQRILSSAESVEYANISAVITSLARDGEVSAALRLFGALFAALPPKPGREASMLPGEATHLMTAWNYREEMTKCLRPLAAAAGVRFLQCLCRVLDEHLRIASKGGFQGPDDFSYIWRPAIEQHDQNADDDHRDTVVTAIRECALEITDQNPEAFAQVIEALEAEQWAVFTRIALFLLAESSSASIGTIARYATEPYLFSELSVRHEYALLLNKRFRTLSLIEQEAILKMVANGPDLSSYASFILRGFSRPASAEELSAHSRRWQYDWLSFIKGDLPASWKSRFEELGQEFGQPEHPEFPYYSTSRFGVGSASHLGLGYENGMSVTELLDKFVDGRADAKIADEYAQAIRSLTEEDRTTIAERITEVASLQIPLLRTVTFAFISSITAGAPSDPTTLLRLCELILQRASSAADENERDALADLALSLVYQFLPNDRGHLPAQQGAALRDIMERLLAFVKTEGEVPRISGNQLDALTDSINSFSGRAVEAGIKIARLEQSPGAALNDSQTTPHWLLSILSGILVRLGDTETRVSAILGQRFPSLAYLSRSWAAEHAGAIFPLGGDKELRWRAAWDSYMSYAGAYDEPFAILRPQYEKAVGEISGKLAEKERKRNAGAGLAEHLASFYWRRRLSLDDSLLQQFMAQGPESEISSFLWAIGRGLRELPELPSELGEVLRSLAVWMVSEWRPRRRAIGKALASFGWWFPHESLGEPLWRLNLLERATARARTVQNPDQVFKALEALAIDYSDPVIACLHNIALGSHSQSTTYYLATDAALVLDKAVPFASRKAFKRVVEIADQLGSLGHFEYRRFATLGEDQGTEHRSLPLKAP